MADQISIQLAETSVAAGSAVTATVNFRTRSTAAASAPTTVRYRVDCLTTGRQIINDTSVSTAASVTIVIPGTSNETVNQDNDIEVRQIAITADYGLDTQVKQSATWRVRTIRTYQSWHEFPDPEARLEPFFPITQSETDAGLAEEDLSTQYQPGDIRRYGANAVPGTTDMTTAIQAMCDALEQSGGGDGRLSAEVYLISSTVLLATGVTLTGIGYSTVIKAAASMDEIILRSKTTSAPFQSDITIRNLKIDGNRTNQTPETEVTGIKMYSVENLLIENLLLEEVEGHAIHVNNSGGLVDGQRIVNTVVRGVGSAPDATFGSCFAVTSGKDFIFDSCHAYDSYKAGFRFSGTNFTFNGCVARDNGNGGLVPVGGDCDGITVNGGFFYNNTPDADHPCDGIRLVGNTRVQLNGVTCYGNADNGLSILNGCEDVIVNGGFFFNNGQSSEAPGALQRRSGIAIWDDANSNERIRILGAHLYDDQGSPTQDYGIEIDDLTDDVLVDSCCFGAAQIERLSLTTSTNTIRVSNGNVGLTFPAFTIDGASVTGTTAYTDLFTVTVGANEFGRRGRVRFSASGTFAGVNGTKIIRVAAGGSTIDFAATGSGVEAEWRVEGEIAATATTGVRLSASLTYGTNTEAIYEVLTVDTTADWAFAIRGKLSNSADTIDGQTIDFDRLR